ncbi:NAD-dependent epimerase/dehydratase family protein [Frateuria soli]|uniref:NAD-dependent epimerase/dehydratase family protein n=1 Tax=Frateuria soli TaxID=1542730 RepID=UPI001E57A147|nr:NAD-dependent epimerase/dehydratase family protein [Frateuria soli]UGB38282.1 NAD-dependent epimerase/dehydratase family protein [Frateuria soli]
MDLDARILITGQCGWVAGAVARRLGAAGFSHVRVVLPGEVGLTRAAAVERVLFQERPEYVFLTTGRGEAGSDQAVRESMAVQANVIHAAWRADVRKLCFLASSRIFPAGALPPLREGALLTAVVEPGEGSEALAQMAGIRMCQVYRRQYRFDAISMVPDELYGPGDGEGARAGVVAALVQRLYRARRVGAPQVSVESHPARAWLHVDDFADAALFLMRRDGGEMPINVDGGEAPAFADLARMVAEVVGYAGRLVFDASAAQPPRTVAEGLRLNNMGWAPCMPLRQGVEQVFAWSRRGVAPVVA